MPGSAMTWNDITVQQYQQLTELWLGSKDVEPLFIMADEVEICYRLTRHQVDSLSMQEFQQFHADLNFLREIPDWQMVKHFKANGRRYRFVYDVRQIHAARNIEVKHFSQGDFIQNLHKSAASMVMPQRRNVFGKWRDEEYDASKHEQYAADMLQAPITAVYGSAVFFCAVWTKSIEAMSDYLTSPKTMAKIPTKMQEELRKLLLDSCKTMGGSLTPQQSPSWSGLP